MQLDPAVHVRTARIAEGHFGYVTRDQAYAAGHTEESLRDRSGRNRLERVNVRLFRQRGAPRSWQGDIYAAAVGCPGDAVASAMSVAALFGACRPPTVPHVLARRGTTPRGVQGVVHQADLHRLDRTTFGVIPITGPSRVPIDCARLLRRDALDEIVDALFTSGVTNRDQVLASIARSGLDPRRSNLPQLLDSMEVWHPGMTHDSVAEARMFRLLVSWGHPVPVPLYEIRTDDGAFVCEVDAAWPDAKVALEYDSVRHHSPRRWPRDEARIAAAVALGWTFVPVDKTDVAPAGQVRLRAELARLLPSPASILLPPTVAAGGPGVVPPRPPGGDAGGPTRILRPSTGLRRGRPALRTRTRP